MHAYVGCLKSMQEYHSMSFTDTGQSIQKKFAKLAASFLLTQPIAETFTGWGCALSADDCGHFSLWHRRLVSLAVWSPV